MKVFKWSVALMALAAIATSCGQPKSNRKQLTNNDVDPQTALLMEQTSSEVNVDALISRNEVFNESSIDTSDQGLIMLGHMNAGNSFVGNIFYGTKSNPYKGEQMTLSFDKREGSSYIYVNIMSGRGNAYAGVQPSPTSELNVSYHKISLHENTNCLIVEYTISAYEAVVCKQ
jgi:hypothetical protein